MKMTLMVKKMKKNIWTKTKVLAKVSPKPPNKALSNKPKAEGNIPPMQAKQVYEINLFKMLLLIRFIPTCS